MPTDRILHIGQSGTDVAEWQRTLTKLGYPAKDDGAFGPKTRLATHRFQRTRGIVADGKVGPVTRAEAASVLAALYPAEYPAAPVPASPVPAAWKRWNGARPEPRGAPQDTIIAVPGLAGMSPDFRRGLLDLCDAMGIPVDSMAAIICSESRFNPKALNPLPAAGLIQLTVGAGLPGFTTSTAVRKVIEMSPEEQLERVIRPYYARMPAANGADPGRLYMLNFLPADANKGEAFRLGISESHPEAPTDLKAKKWRNAVYTKNLGFDRARRGYFTIGDVYGVAASICKLAKGKRIAVDGAVT